ncbi:MFS transporter [Thermomonospora catenispora]|uniref:MFS transporter n=1 Tax=Thermomonospora catenispora TaxID=2493090 RepID=UPI00111CD114|nr:MDR family MFS transporter [Thermomonospora catenispora]TNY35624.1 DHA2 family efflux MFS transporter permease subunit [Thermomonospora catenispora]
MHGAVGGGTAVAAEPTGLPRRGRLYAILGALMMAMLLAALDQTIVATALPTIVGELRGAEHLSWVVTAYLLATTTVTPLWGRLGDQYGRKHLFLLSIVIFLVGSALCGLARAMPELIAFRAVQGVGGGGLMSLAVAIVGDVVPPRERGRYQGLFGAVFGVSSVLGPLLGGFFVDHLSWPWVFYVNLPLGAAALAVIATVLPADRLHERHRIDYPGIALLSAATICLVLAATWGGTEYAWGSPVIVGLLGAAAATLGWLASARRAAEPVLPLRLFTVEVFVVAAALGCLVGFAMFGALTYLPLYLQVVHGVSATLSGVHLLPMVAGMLVGSIGSGQLISRYGRYKVFPVVGMTVTTLALWLLSRVEPATSTAVLNGDLAALGLGLGLVMQVIVIAAQNAVPYRDLGAATAGVTFFRSIGGSFGVAMFGSLFASRLERGLARVAEAGGLPPGFDPRTAGEDPAVIGVLPPALQERLLQVYNDAIAEVFGWAAPVAAIGVLLALLLPEIPLRATAKAGPDLGEGMAGAPTYRTSRQEVEGRLSRLMMRDAGAREMYARLGVLAEVHLPAGSMWALCRIAEEGSVSSAELARRAGVPVERGRPYVDRLVKAGYVVRRDGRLEITDAGRATAERLFAARNRALERHLAGWSPEDHLELTRLLAELARHSLDAPPELRESARR